MKPVHQFAKPDVQDRLPWLHPFTMMIMCDVIMWAVEKGLPAVISDAVTTLGEDEGLKRQSATHREGRAFDMSTRGWKREHVDECMRVFSFKYRYLSAMGTQGQPVLVYFHNAGTGDHLHFQINKKYALPVVEFKTLT